MRLEQYDVNVVRNEYVQGVAKGLSGKVTQQEFDKMLTMLDDFILALNQNNIILIKIVVDTQLIPNEIPVGEQVQEETITEESIPAEEFDEFDDPVSTPQENSLKEVYEKKMRELEEREKAIREIENAKPKNFTEKVRQFEAASVKKKNDDADEEDD